MSELTLGTTSSSSSSSSEEAGDSRSSSPEASSEHLSAAAQRSREQQLREELRGNVASSSHVTDAQIADIVNQQVQQRLDQLLPGLLAAANARDDGRHTNRVAPRDVKLEPFSGNTDDSAHVIDKNHFLPLLEWLDSSIFTLRASKLDPSHYVSKLLFSLTGAAKRAFVARFGNVHNVSEWTLDQARSNIASLVPDHDVLFTLQALNMSFSKSSLPDDLQKFRLYIEKGNLPIDNIKLYVRLIQDKLVNAFPECLTIAATRYGKHLQYKPVFSEMFADAQTLVAELAANGHLTSSVLPKRLGDVSEPTVAKRSKRSYGTTPQAIREPPKPTKPIDADNSEDAELKRLAKRFHRCFECGLYMPRGLNVHKPKCYPSLQRFRSRLRGAKKTLEAGGDVNGDSK
jgi:hypothetical protein